eukprot:scaffold2943_cov379-Prasinococcus_capsulatus_cf.AAC.1
MPDWRTSSVADAPFVGVRLWRWPQRGLSAARGPCCSPLPAAIAPGAAAARWRCRRRRRRGGGGDAARNESSNEADTTIAEAPRGRGGG